MRVTLCQWTSPCSRAKEGKGKDCKSKEGKGKEGKGKTKAKEVRDKFDSQVESQQVQEVFLL